MAIWQTDLPLGQDRLETGVGRLVMFGLLAGRDAIAVAWRLWLGTGRARDPRALPPPPAPGTSVAAALPHRG